MHTCSVTSLVPNFFATLWTIAHKAPLLWDSPGKNTGVGCRFLLQGIFPTQGSNPGLLHCRQTLWRLSKWVAIPSFRGSSQHRDRTWVSWVSCIAGEFITTDPPGKPLWIVRTPQKRTKSQKWRNNHWNYFKVLNYPEVKKVSKLKGHFDSKTNQPHTSSIIVEFQNTGHRQTVLRASRKKGQVAYSTIYIAYRIVEYI